MANIRERSYLDKWAKELIDLSEELYGANNKARTYYVVVEFSNKQGSVMMMLVALVSWVLVMGLLGLGGSDYAGRSVGDDSFNRNAD